MLTKLNRTILKTGLLILLQFCFPLFLLSQTHIVKGVVRDESTLKPVPDVNIRVSGAGQGAATDHKGEFNLVLENLPSTIIISCIGYETFSYKVEEISRNRVEFILKSKSYTLKEVNITSSPYSFLFKDQDYSVLDYELMDGNILLLVFRTLLNRSQLILLDRNGDTLTVEELPESHPIGLRKDFLNNVYYFTRADNAYQCYFNQKDGELRFLPGVRIDSLQNIFRYLIFTISNRVYFNESQLNGFGTAFGYYQKGEGKKYIRQYQNEKKIAENLDDQKFYSRWNQFIASQIPPGELSAARFAQSPKLGQYMNQYDVRAYGFEFYKMIYPVIKTKDNSIAFFNFGDGVIEIYDMDGKFIRIVPISFHKEQTATADSLNPASSLNQGWRWTSTIMIDERNRDVYTSYTHSGILRINKIDLQTGRLKSGREIPLPFPEKIEIFDGDAFFIYKGINENWKLAKCKL